MDVGEIAHGAFFLVSLSSVDLAFAQFFKGPSVDNSSLEQDIETITVTSYVSITSYKG